jgi:predicted nuclease of predicted toxin-antitoxin system
MPLSSKELPDKNRTTASEIIELLAREMYVAFTKDRGFADSMTLNGELRPLWPISAGNIRNTELTSLYLPKTAAVASAFQTGDFCFDLSRTALTVHWQQRPQP